MQRNIYIHILPIGMCVYVSALFGGVLVLLFPFFFLYFLCYIDFGIAASLSPASRRWVGRAALVGAPPAAVSVSASRDAHGKAGAERGGGENPPPGTERQKGRNCPKKALRRQPAGPRLTHTKNPAAVPPRHRLPSAAFWGGSAGGGGAPPAVIFYYS